jgi:hypothetical protein
MLRTRGPVLRGWLFFYGLGLAGALPNSRVAINLSNNIYNLDAVSGCV